MENIQDENYRLLENTKGYDGTFDLYTRIEFLCNHFGADKDEIYVESGLANGRTPEVEGGYFVISNWRNEFGNLSNVLDSYPEIEMYWYEAMVRCEWCELLFDVGSYGNLEGFTFDDGIMCRSCAKKNKQDYIELALSMFHIRPEEVDLDIVSHKELVEFGFELYADTLGLDEVDTISTELIKQDIPHIYTDGCIWIKK